jgi:hypothetical protein
MLEFIKVNRKVFSQSFGFTTVIMLLIILVINTLNKEFSKPLDFSIFIEFLGLSIFVGLIVLLVILTLSTINFVIGNQILNSRAFDELAKLEFKKIYMDATGKWSIANQGYVGIFNEFPISIICNPNSSETVDIVIHIDAPIDKKQNESIQSQILNSKIIYTPDGLQISHPLKRKHFEDENILIQDIQQLSDFASKNSLKPLAKQ